MTRTASALHLDGGKLKRRMMAPDGVAKRAAAPAFVELLASEAGALAQCAIELEGRRGRMRIELRDPGRGPASVVVTIRQPEVEHRVRIKDFENWLDSAGKSPAQMALKTRLRSIVGR